MSDLNIILPSQLSIISEVGTKGVYEIDGLYPGYGHTLGNSLRRIILSSLTGAAITSLKIENAQHEFSVLEGVKEDVIAILLNLKRVRFSLVTDEAQKVTLSVKGPKIVTAGDIKGSGQVEILNKDLKIAEITGKGTSLDIEMTVEKGLGFVSKDTLQKGKVEIGTIAVDAIFTPIRRVSYEVENMRVGDRTDYNRLRIYVETDGTITPSEALKRSIEIMIYQLKAIVDFVEKEETSDTEWKKGDSGDDSKDADKEDMSDIMKTRIDTLNFSTRTFNALSEANIRTVGGLARKREEDLLEIEGIGEKGIQEIKRALGEFGINLK